MTTVSSRATKALFAAVVVALFTFAGSSALTASNTVPASQAGDGAGGITGYTVSAVSYTLDAADPQEIDEVTFTLDSTPAAGSDIQVRLDSTSSDWYSCTFAGISVTCSTTAPTAAVVDADELRVVAVD